MSDNNQDNTISVDDLLKKMYPNSTEDERLDSEWAIFQWMNPEEHK